MQDKGIEIEYPQLNTIQNAIVPQHPTMTIDWQSVIQAKKERTLANIPKEWILSKVPPPEQSPNVQTYLDSILPANENDITSKSATVILRDIASGNLSAHDVTLAFCRRAAMTHQMTNCLSEVFFDKALKRAEELDLILKTTGKTVGPLHGLPISLKDQVNIEGVDTTIGYVAPLLSDDLQRKICGYAKDDKTESLIAQILYAAGAIFYVKTAVPMAMLGPETSSNFGYTVNSKNRLLTSGGSSGGEASLIGARGSVIGLGTDIGGSIRAPSAFQGLYGLKASSNRFPYLNVANSMPDQTIVPSVIGPMARHLEDLELVSRTIIESRPWFHDSKVPPLEWKNVNLPKVMSFGILKWDHIVMPNPGILRALKMVEGALKKMGHEVIEMHPPFSHQNLFNLLLDLFAADGFQEVESYLADSGEPVPKLFKKVMPQNRKQVDISTYWKYAKETYQYRQAYDEYLNSTAKCTFNGEPIVAYFAPAWGTTAWRPFDIEKVISGYTRHINILDYTVLTIPITTVDKDIDVNDPNYVPVNDQDASNFNYYDPELLHGMPVVLQIVCRRYEEEKAIAIAKIVKEALHQE